MDSLRSIDFTDALVRLQALIEADVTVTVNFHEHFFGCGMKGKLDRVETLRPDDTAIKVVLNEVEGFFLDPEDTSAFLISGEDGEEVLELRLGFGPTVMVEPTPPPSDQETEADAT